MTGSVSMQRFRLFLGQCVLTVPKDNKMHCTKCMPRVHTQHPLICMFLEVRRKVITKVCNMYCILYSVYDVMKWIICNWETACLVEVKCLKGKNLKNLKKLI